MSERAILERVPRRFAVADLDLERFLVGDLDAAARAHVEAAAAADPALDHYLRERRGEIDAFRQTARAPDFSTATPARRSWLGLSLGGGLLAASLAALLLFVVPSMPEGSVDSDIRARGDLKVSLVARRDQRVFVYRPGVLLRAGDQVRLSIESPSAGFLTVLSRDAHGVVTTIYDNLPTHAGTFTPPDSLILDDAVGPEIWWVVLSTTVRSIDMVSAAWQRGAPLDGAAVASVEIHKEPPGLR